MKYKFIGLVLVAALLGILVLRWTQSLPKVDLISAELTSQIMRAKAALPKFKERLEHPQNNDRAFFLRVKFSDKKNTEFLWMNHVQIQGDDFSASIAETPYVIPGKHLGDVLPVKSADIVDWTIKHEDGSMEGNFTQGLEPNRH